MPSRSFIEKGGSAHLEIGYAGPPQEFHFLLLPKVTMLALAAAIEPLRIANQLTGQQLYRWFTMTEDNAPVVCSNGLSVTPDQALSALPPEAIGFVCSGVEPERAASPGVLAWIRRENRFGRHLGGICTGSYALAEAGLLRNRRFTLHWENQDGFCEHYPMLTPTPNLFEIDGPVLTCGGGNAAIDMMLALIEKSHGPELAILVADMCLHMRSIGASSPQKSAHSIAIGSRNPHLLSALTLMHKEIEEPRSIEQLCEELAVSRRQLERLFKRYMRQSPMNCYLDIRLSRAFALLRETNMSVMQIAVATGFSTSSHLARRFRKKYGHPPHQFRSFWA